MKKFLFPVIALLLLAGCSSSSGDAIDEPEPPKYNINSVILVDDIKLQGYIFKGYYYIEAIDASDNKLFTIKDEVEGYIEDLGFGDKKEYPINGCYIEGALKKGDLLYILVSLYGHLEYHPHKFIIKTENGKILKKEYFDKTNSSEDKVLLYPECIADWYRGYILLYTTYMTNGSSILVLDEDLNNVCGKKGVGLWVEKIRRDDYIPISESNMVYVNDKTVSCVDISKYEYEDCFLWETVITEEEIRVDKTSYSLEGDNVIADVEATTKAGEKKKYHLVLNSNTGEIITSNQITQ